MPFTPAHAAAALPFRRTGLIPSAVVVGCLSPDFEYFLRLAPRGGLGHTLLGLFVLDLPLGLLFLWLFHAYTKQPLWTSLPCRIRVKVPLGPLRLPAQSPRQFALLCLSVVIGAGTHILWDSFTHRHYWPNRHWPFLHHVFPLPILGVTPVYKLLQYASSIFGILVLVFWWVRWSRNAPKIEAAAEQRSTHQSRAVLGIALGIAIGGALLRALLGAGVPTDHRGIALFLAEVVVTSITLFWLEITACGITQAIRESGKRHHFHTWS